MSNTNQQEVKNMNIGKVTWDTIRQYPSYGQILPVQNKTWEELGEGDQVANVRIGDAAKSGGGLAAAKAFQDSCLEDPDVVTANLMKALIMMGKDYQDDYRVNQQAWDAVATAVGYKAQTTNLAQVAWEVFRQEAVDMPGEKDILEEMFLDLVFPKNVLDLPPNLQDLWADVASTAAQTDRVEDTYEKYRAGIKNGLRDLPAFADTRNCLGEKNPEMWTRVVDAVFEANHTA